MASAQETPVRDVLADRRGNPRTGADALRTESADRIRHDVGLQLRLHRHRAGLSQTQVAAATGWSLSAISMYEQGNREASYAKLLSLARLFGVSVGDFFETPHGSPDARLRELEARVTSLEGVLGERLPQGRRTSPRRRSAP